MNGGFRKHSESEKTEQRPISVTRNAEDRFDHTIIVLYFEEQDQDHHNNAHDHVDTNA